MNDQQIKEHKLLRNQQLDSAMESIVKTKLLRPPKNMPTRPDLVYIKEDFNPISALFGKG